MLERTIQNLDSLALIPAGSAVLAAVSGGVDSMVLLDALARLSPERTWRIQAAHFNHQLRGAESEGDEELVRRRAMALGIPCVVERGNVRGWAAERGLSIEMAARELRHRFLARTAASQGISLVGLAHHADDQVETFWLRLLRGDVGPGAAGMRWKRPSEEDRHVHLVRPFLNVFKEEILEYARARGVEFREDSTNQDIHHQRNRIRHGLLPALAEYQPNLRNITLRAAEVLGSEKEFIARAAASWLHAPAEEFNQLSPALQREIVRSQLMEAEITPDFDLIETLRLQPGKRVSVAKERTVWRDPKGRIQAAACESQEFDGAEFSIDVGRAGSLEAGNVRLEWERVGERGPGAEGAEYFDADAVGAKVRIRFWQPGDRYQPIGSAHSIKLQDAFTNLKVPPAERRKRLVAIAEGGGIFWVEGLRIGERFKVTAASRQALKWSWKQKASSSTLTYATNQT